MSYNPQYACCASAVDAGAFSSMEECYDELRQPVEPGWPGWYLTLLVCEGGALTAIAVLFAYFAWTRR